MKKYEYNLLELCQELHMNSNSSSDTLLCGSPWTFIEAYKTVKERLDNWTESVHGQQYDRTVYLLCVAATEGAAERFPHYFK